MIESCPKAQKTQDSLSILDGSISHKFLLETTVFSGP